MMGSRRTNEKDQPPTFTNPLTQANCISPNIQSTRSANFQEGNVSAGHFESIPDSPILISPNWENMYSMNQPFTQRMPETSGNPMPYLMNPSSFQNPQINLNSSTANTDLDWNTKWSPPFINQGHNAISAGGMSNGGVISNFENPWSSKNPSITRSFAGDLQMNIQAGESKFRPFNRPQSDGDFVHSPLHYRNNVNLNSSQRGIQGKVEGSFLSLGIGGTEEAIPTSQPSSREISDKLKAMGQTLNANFSGFQRNTSGPGSSPYHVLQMQQNDMQHGIPRHDDSNSTFLSIRNIGYGDANHHRASVGNQAVHSGTIGGNSAQFLNSQQYGLNTPSGQLQQNIRFKLPTESSMNSSLKLGSSSTRQNYAGKHPYLQNHIMPTQGPGGGLFSHSQRTAVPQVSWVSSGEGVTDLPFPKRLGVGSNGRDSPQAAERQVAIRGTSQGQSQMVQVPKKSEFYVRPYHKRSAPSPSGPHWVQRQKMTHPNPSSSSIHHHSMPIRLPTKPAIPVTTTTLVHPSIPISQSQSVRAPPIINPSIPYTSNFRPTRVPTLSHITCKDPELTRYKCLLCKRDLSLTSEGAVYQPTAPPAVAVLPCGHTFHDQCLQKITPQDQAKDPPCIPCAIGEN